MTRRPRFEALLRLAADIGVCPPSRIEAACWLLPALDSPVFEAAAIVRLLGSGRPIRRRFRRSRSTRNGGQPVVYFVAGGDRIKIGLTGDLKRRLDDLRMCSPLPLDVLVTIPGDLNVEQYLHRRFAALRSHGEWFRAENPLLSFITDLKRAETPKGVGGRVGENAA